MLLSVMSFADTMLAEAEFLYHGGAHLPVDAKVKSLDRVQDVSKDGKGQGKSGGKEDSGSGATKVCKYFTSEGGCKKGKQCSYAHEWGSVNKYGRCWNCGSSQHRREDCPVRDSPQKPQVKKGKAASGDKKAEEVPVVEKVEETTSAQGSDGAPAGGGDKGSEAKDSQVAGLLAEATHLLRSMRPSQGGEVELS